MTYQEKRPVISVLRRFARLQADGKLKNKLFLHYKSVGNNILSLNLYPSLIPALRKIAILSVKTKFMYFFAHDCSSE